MFRSIAFSHYYNNDTDKSGLWYFDFHYPFRGVVLLLYAP